MGITVQYNLMMKGITCMHALLLAVMLYYFANLVSRDGCGRMIANIGYIPTWDIKFLGGNKIPSLTKIIEICC